MAQIMAKAAKLPARPWPLMIGVVYEAGSNPAIPKMLPCNTAPKAVENKIRSNIPVVSEYWLCSWYNSTGNTRNWEHAQLMMTVFTMVTQKKGSGSKGTLTITAVTMNITMMTTRLPNTRKCWDILKRSKKRNNNPERKTAARFCFLFNLVWQIV